VPPLPATREHYREVIAEETAPLIVTSCRYRAVLSGVDEFTDADVARALATPRASGGLARLRAEAAERVEAAVGHLAIFGERKVVTALERLAHYALDRLG